MEIKLIGKSEKGGSVTLPKEMISDASVFTLTQAVRVQEDNLHAGLARVKTRGQVHITGKKVYKQKHTGNARHGAASAPIFVGGGVTHGPDGVKTKLSLPKKVSQIAKKVAIAQMAKNKSAYAIEVGSVKKTSEASKLLKEVSEKSVLVLLSKENSASYGRFFKNIPTVTVKIFDLASAYDIVTHQSLVIDSSMFGTKEKAK
jgi:large subunit ribosomal protein L4